MGKGRASASLASSFASAMLRSIQRLSASFTISAASGELSVITSIEGMRLAPERGAGLARRGVHAADQDRDRLQVADRLALGQPLGAEGHVHMRLGGEDLVVHQPGGARRHRALDHHELAVGDVRRDAAAGGADMAQVRLELLRQRRADGDQDRLRRPSPRPGRSSPSQLPAATPAATSASSPGSGIGQLPAFSAAIISALVSTPTTLSPRRGQHGGDHAADVAEADDGDDRGRCIMAGLASLGTAGRGGIRVADIHRHLFHSTAYASAAGALPHYRQLGTGAPRTAPRRPRPAPPPISPRRASCRGARFRRRPKSAG